MSQIKLEFLGFGQAALPAAAEYLFDRYGAQRRVDLSAVIIVMPGRRAGRRLLEILVARADEQKWMLVPPTIQTVGSLPEDLYTPQRPFASEFVQGFAWAHVLQAATPRQLAPLLPRGLPEEESGRWRELGELLRRQHLELAADGLSFRDVADQVEKLAGEEEKRRWETLADLQAAYLHCLDGLQLWDRQTARLTAIELQECRTEKEIVLIGTADINVATRQMLDQVAEHVTALVFAEASWRERFDRHGCLVAQAWQDVQLPLDDRQWEIVRGPAEQAESAARWLQQLDGRYAVDEITLGVADESLLPDMQRRMRESDVPVRWGPGTPLNQSPPVRLLVDLANFVEQRRFEDFASLVRHVDVDRWLETQVRSGDWIQELDDYQADHLPYRLPTKWLGRRADSKGAQEAAKQVERLVKPLRGNHPLEAWPERIREGLRLVYADSEFHPGAPSERAYVQAMDGINQTLDEFETVPSSLTPTLNAAEALRLIAQRLTGQSVAGPTDDAIEMLGWLELTLDDAPALVVTSFNDGFVPQSVNSDLFLPNSLRSKLNLLDNQRRYARDAYALATLIASRSELRLISGRHNRDGDPLAPSRLVFATDAETAARRAVRFFDQVDDGPAIDLTGPETPLRLQIPRPVALQSPLKSISVTSFRDYLACPYRFYLRHVLGLSAVDDSVEELTGGAFGSLAHEVLGRFGSSPIKDSTNADEIREYLKAELDRCLHAFYGRRGGEPSAQPAVYVQAEQLRLRLARFADEQAKWAGSGWRIAHAESHQRQEVAFVVDGEPIMLRGRIDRMDIHDDGRRVVLDYKTSESGASPSQVHLRKESWVDLQLPLYRHLAADLPGDGPLEMGFVLLPKDESRTAFHLAEWSPQQLEEADTLARDVIRRLREQIYWPPADPPPSFSEAFAAICQDRVMERTGSSPIAPRS